MHKGNIDNLVDNKDRTPEERRANAKKAGLASGKARAKKKMLQDALKKALLGKYSVGKDENIKKLGGYEAMALSMIQECLNGNVQAFKEIRDTIGEKPKDTIGFENEDESLTSIKISFVNKSHPKTIKETDPKIVGDYTPPNNTEES